MYSFCYIYVHDLNISLIVIPLLIKLFINSSPSCRIDDNGIIKVADFGLTEDVYEHNYFRQDTSSIKLPVKWMAPESIHDRLFTHKSDVV